MKKFTKIMLILAGVLASVGVICMVVAFGMGLTMNHFIKMIQDGRFSFDAGDFHISYDDDWKDDFEGETLGTENEDGESVDGEIREVCANIDLEFGAGILEISYADVDYIQVKQTNIPKIKASVKNDTLVIRDETNVHVDIDGVEDRRLTILIPREMEFEDVELQIGASKADISNICAKDFELEVGAGQANIADLKVEKLDVKAGVGQVNIELNGVQSEYNYRVECGIGHVVVGKSSYSGLGSEDNVKFEGATKEINVECGIGEVRIEFQDEAEMFEEI